MMNKLCSGKTSWTLLMGALLLGGCATAPLNHPATASKADPYEGVNRDVFAFNDTVDNYVAKPIADAYKWVTPQFAQTGIFNFFNNLKNVNVVLNDVLQGKFEQSAEDTGRLLVNSTVGLGGLVDVAEDVGLKQNDEDFEQTLAVWGVPEGPYLVLPMLGPTTVRGIPGAVFDTAANPASYIGMPVQLVSLLNTRANAQGSLDVVKEGALDPYVFIREGYLQTRHHLASDGKSQQNLDVDNELDDDSASDTEKNNSKHTLRLSAAEQNATSFTNTTKSFDLTAESFRDAGRKIEQLESTKHNKKLRRRR